MLRDYYKSMQQPISDEIKQEYARLPLFQLMEDGERPLSVAESLVGYDPSKASSSSGLNADLDGASQAGTLKKGKRASSASKGSNRSPSSPKSPNGGKKGTSKKEKDSQPSVNLAAQVSEQDELIKNLKPKLLLVPRRPISAFESTNTKKQRADDANATDHTPPPDDMDERLIFDAHRLATQYVNDMVRFFLFVSLVFILWFSFSWPTNKPPQQQVLQRRAGKMRKFQRVTTPKETKKDGKRSGGKESVGKKGAKKVDEPPAEREQPFFLPSLCTLHQPNI